MGDNLAQLLYEALRANAPAGSDMAPWGLLESAEREAFEAMATTARKTMAERFVRSIDDVTLGGAVTHVDGVRVSHVLRARWAP